MNTITRKEVLEYRAYKLEIEALELEINDAIRIFNGDTRSMKLVEIYNSRIKINQDQIKKIDTFINEIQDKQLQQAYQLWIQGYTIHKINKMVYEGYYADGSIKNKLYRYIEKYNKMCSNSRMIHA